MWLCHIPHKQSPCPKPLSCSTQTPHLPMKNMWLTASLMMPVVSQVNSPRVPPPPSPKPSSGTPQARPKSRDAARKEHVVDSRPNSAARQRRQGKEDNDASSSFLQLRLTFWHLSIAISLHSSRRKSTLAGDKVCMSTHAYSPNPLRKMKVTIFIHQADCPVHVSIKYLIW